MVVNDNGAIAAWINLDDGKMLEITDTPGNTPRLYVAIVQMSDAELLAHLNSEQMEGWTVVRANFEGQDKLNMDSDGVLQDSSILGASRLSHTALLDAAHEGNKLGTCDED